MVAEITPPAFLEGERAAIAACLLDNNLIATVAGELEEADFYHEAERTLFHGIMALHRADRPVDFVTLSDILNRHGKLEQAGGVVSLMDLADALPSTANIRHYLSVVKDKSNLRRMLAASRQIAAACCDPGATAGEIQEQIEALAFDSVSRSRTKGLRKIDQVLSGAIESLQRRRETGMMSGFHGLDAMTRGFRPGELTIIGGRPSMGKSAFATDIALSALAKTAVAFFSLEMSESELAGRLISKKAQVNLLNIGTGHGSGPDWDRAWDAVGILSEYPLLLDDTSRLSVSQIKSRLREATVRTKLDIGMVVVDYLQIMDHESDAKRTTNEAIGKTTMGLKALSKDLNCSVICLSQLNRNLEQRTGHDRRPRMADFRDSGSIEQDADLILGLYRPQVYSDAKEFENIADAIILKQRNGPTGLVPLAWKKETATFYNLVAEPEEHHGR